MSILHRILAAAAAVLIGLLVAGCVQQPDKPSDCGQPGVTRNATLTSDGLDPRNVDVCRGQQLELAVKIQTAGELHIHGYDAQAKEVRVGQTITFDFTAVRSGQFVIELHTQAQPSELNMGVLTVHEP